MDYNGIIQQAKEQQGYTHSINGRYVVAVDGYEETLSVEDFTSEVLESYVERHKKDEFGIWIEEGTVYLDIVECHDNASKAMRIAKERNEKAIFDLKELATIYV